MKAPDGRGFLFLTLQIYIPNTDLICTFSPVYAVHLPSPPLPRYPQSLTIRTVILRRNGLLHGHDPLLPRSHLRNRKIRRGRLSSQRNETRHDDQKSAFPHPSSPSPLPIRAQTKQANRPHAPSPRRYPSNLRPRRLSRHLLSSEGEISAPYKFHATGCGDSGWFELS